MVRQSIIVLLLLFIYSSFAEAEIYKWLDEQGKTHYGDKPVTNSKEMHVDTSKQGHVKVNVNREKKRQKLLETYADDKQREDKEKAKKKKSKKKMQRKCTLARDRLRRYERASSLYSLDNSGNRITMSTAERQRTVTELRKKIKINCKK
jgi:catalase